MVCSRLWCVHAAARHVLLQEDQFERGLHTRRQVTGTGRPDGDAACDLGRKRLCHGWTELVGILIRDMAGTDVDAAVAHRYRDDLPHLFKETLPHSSGSLFSLWLHEPSFPFAGICCSACKSWTSVDS